MDENTFLRFFQTLDERQARLCAAERALAIGRGGITLVSRGFRFSSRSWSRRRPGVRWTSCGGPPSRRPTWPGSCLIARSIYLRALVGARAVPVSPFLVSFDEHDAGLFRNYAIPDDNATPTEAQVAELVAVFTGRSRTPRLECCPPQAVPRGRAATRWISSPSGGYR